MRPGSGLALRLATIAICAAAGAGSALIASSTPARAAPAFVTTTVNLRQGPGTNTPVLAKIPGGSAVNVAGCRGEWCQISFAGMAGYVIATALGQGGPPPGYAPPPPGYAPPPPGYAPPPAYVMPPPYYGPYYGYGPSWRWHRHWRGW